MVSVAGDPIVLLSPNGFPVKDVHPCSLWRIGKDRTLQAYVDNTTLYTAHLSKNSVAAELLKKQSECKETCRWHESLTNSKRLNITFFPYVVIGLTSKF